MTNNIETGRKLGTAARRRAKAEAIKHALLDAYDVNANRLEDEGFPARAERVRLHKKRIEELIENRMMTVREMKAQLLLVSGSG